MANGTTATTIKNAYGNVTESSVGNRKVTYHYNNDQLPDVITEKIGNSTTETAQNSPFYILILSETLKNIFILYETEINIFILCETLILSMKIASKRAKTRVF